MKETANVALDKGCKCINRKKEREREIEEEGERRKEERQEEGKGGGREEKSSVLVSSATILSDHWALLSLKVVLKIK